MAKTAEHSKPGPSRRDILLGGSALFVSGALFGYGVPRAIERRRTVIMPPRITPVWVTVKGESANQAFGRGEWARFGGIRGVDQYDQEEWWTAVCGTSASDLDQAVGSTMPAGTTPAIARRTGVDSLKYTRIESVGSFGERSDRSGRLYVAAFQLGPGAIEAAIGVADPDGAFIPSPTTTVLASVPKPEMAEKYPGAPYI